MNNRKKWIAMGAGVGLGAVMLTVSGLSAMAGTSGYEAWKSAVKQTKTAESIAGAVTLTVTDNDKRLAGAEAAFKKDGSGASANVQVNAGAMSHEMNVYLQDGRAILKPGDSDTYQVTEPWGDGGHGWKHDSNHAPDPAMVQRVERVFDALVGNLKDRVTLTENADGSKQATLSLSGNQVPVAINAIGSLLIGGAADGDHWKHGKPGWADEGQAGAGAETNGDSWFAPGAGPEMPKLTQDIRVESIELDATIDADNYMDAQTAEIHISGKDADGTAHSVVVQAAIDLSGVNATVADTVDLTGKNVQTIEHNKEGGHPGGRW